MTPDDRMAVYRRHLAAEQDSHDPHAAAAEYADDGYYDIVAFGVVLRSRTAVEHNYATTMRAIPDIHFEIDGEVMDGDTLVHWGTMVGTVIGPYLGQPPTGRHLRVPFLARFEFGDGVIQGEQVWFDAATLCEQAGLDLETARTHVRAFEGAVGK